MGCSYSKPWKKTGDVVAAYQWDGRDCGCGSNTFKLVHEPAPDDNGATVNTSFQQVKDIVEPKLREASGLVIENATRSCFCASQNFDEGGEAINKDLAPSINAKLEPLGYVLDAFMWHEWHHNGQSSQKIYYLILRIRDIGALQTEHVDGEEKEE